MPWIPASTPRRRDRAYQRSRRSEIAGWEETDAFFRVLQDRLEAQPGIEAVGFAQSAPLTSGLSFWAIGWCPTGLGAVEGRDGLRGAQQVSAGYLETIGIDLVEGRTFEPTDGAGGYPAVIVDQAFAEHYYQGESPLGRTFPWDEEAVDTIVGVVENAHYETLEEAPDADRPLAQLTVGERAAATDEQERRRGPAHRGRPGVVHRGDPPRGAGAQRAHPRVEPAHDGRRDGSGHRPDVVHDGTPRIAASGIALLLGLVGIYGVISYIVSQRTREIGVRMALGATAPSVRSMVVRQGLIARGWRRSHRTRRPPCLMSRVMATLLYGVSATDPLTYVSVALALVVGVAHGELDCRPRERRAWIHRGRSGRSRTRISPRRRATTEPVVPQGTAGPASFWTLLSHREIFR